MGSHGPLKPERKEMDAAGVGLEDMAKIKGDNASQLFNMQKAIL